MGIYYISDLHFLHKRVIEINNRPFRDLDEMHEVLTLKWNKKVNKKDTIYILGDIAFARNLKQIDEAINIISKLNGRKVLIKGNHDGKAVKNEKFRSLFEEISIYKDLNDNGRRVILMHYPLEVWPGKERLSYHLHGHVHQNNLIRNIERRYNCCVDIKIMSFEPMSLDELILKNECRSYE